MAELLRIVVTGRVQGVGYRFFVERAARALQLSGWVRNRPDGSVEVLARIEPHDKARFLACLREGPPHAAVAGLDVQPADPAEAPAPGGFRIRP